MLSVPGPRRLSARGLFVVALAATVLAAWIAPAVRAATDSPIVTVAGGLGSGPATDVAQSPLSVAVGPGRLVVLDVTTMLPYFDDTYSGTVRTIDTTTGIETVLAGDGEGVGGFAGDGGPATAARFSDPRAVAVDRAGNVFVADAGNNRIRRIDSSGIITTVVGGDTKGFGGDGGPARLAAVNHPTGLAFDAVGNLFFIDDGNDRVRRVAADGTISTVATLAYQRSDGQSWTPGGLFWWLAVSPTGTVTVDITTADGGRAVATVVNGKPTPIAGLGTGGLVADGHGNVYATVYGKVVKITADGTVTTVAGDGNEGFAGDGGPATVARFSRARGLATTSTGALYVADWGNYRVRRIAGGTIDTVAGNGTDSRSGDGRPADTAQLSQPNNIAFGPDGSLYIADTSNNRVRRIDPDGVITTFGEAYDPAVLTVSDAGDVYVSDSGNRVRRITPTGDSAIVAGRGGAGSPGSGDGGPATAATFFRISGLAVLSDGTLLIADGGAGRIWAVDADGTIHTFAGNDKFDSSGDGGAYQKASLADIGDLTLGPDGLYFVEWLSPKHSLRIRRIDNCGTISTVAGGGAGPMHEGALANSATFAYPNGGGTQYNAWVPALAFDHDGNLLVADAAAGRVWRIGADDRAGVIAGNGQWGFSGDGGPATAAAMRGPLGLAVDPYSDVVLISDGNNNRIRAIAPPASPGVVRDCSDPRSTGPEGPSGYWALSGDGHVYNFGDARALGNGSIGAVDVEPSPTGQGYWVLNHNGTVGAFGDAASFGNVNPATLAKGEEAASLSATPTGKGYWVLTNRGRSIPFGDAPFLGDMSQTKLNGPVLGSVATPSGKGYYMVASDGGIFAFGDAAFVGSMGGRKLNAPVQSLVPDADGRGYWLVASDGGIFAFDAPFKGSMGGTKLNKPVVGMVRYGDGYLMVGTDGGIFKFSSLPFSGSLGNRPPASPVVAVAALP